MKKIRTHLKKLKECFFARYGKVVNRADWKRIKKKNKYAYNLICNKKNIKHCYAVSWALALLLDDAKIMYCSIASKTGQTAHAVVVKNGCIYDTSRRKHYDFDEYIKITNAEIYKIFEKDVYLYV